ncbi:hypothetical protein OH77DRAFT_1424730 [Trametes cingulata]|nr:hypothetical protein OH77DRAFT_1424730 [Trametes cingulata]
MSAPPRPTGPTRSKYHERSYTLLEAARKKAHEKKNYDFATTRDKPSQECVKRLGFAPYPEQLDLAECMLLGLNATSIAGTGWGKTLPFVQFQWKSGGARCANEVTFRIQIASRREARC